MRKSFPKQVRFAVWESHCGRVYSHKCFVHYCSNIMKVSDFEVGHIVAHAKGGSDSLTNLLPICNKCNKGMGTKSIPEFNDIIPKEGSTPVPVKEQINEYLEQPLLEKSKPRKLFCCCF